MIEQAVIEQKVGALFGLFSGGHDSLTSTAIAAEHPQFRAAVHINTGIGIEATREFVRETCKAQGWPLLEYHPDGKTYDELVLDKGFPGGPKSHNAMYYWLKQRSIRRLVREHKADGRVGLVTGIRLRESVRRLGAGISVPVRRDGSAVWINPILTWSAADCLRFITEQGLARNPVADLLHRSGECLCGALAQTEELGEIGYWYPEVLERIGTLAEACRAKGLPSVWASRNRLESPPAGQMELCWSCEVPR